MAAEGIRTHPCTNQRRILNRGGGGVTRPFRGMEARRNSAKIQPSGYALRTGQDIKNGGSSTKNGALERPRHKITQETTDEPDSAVDNRKRRKKNSPSA